MFAIALWDKGRRRLLLARDPFGIVLANGVWGEEEAPSAGPTSGGGNPAISPFLNED
jgi:hypothetical protein